MGKAKAQLRERNFFVGLGITLVKEKETKAGKVDSISSHRALTEYDIRHGEPLKVLIQRNKIRPVFPKD